MSLKNYRSKRNFKSTPEPIGKKSQARSKDLYIIQKHAASHLHYDFRLELNGVLKSWAIPKGPSLNPSIKRLAVHVEDHPLEYGSFEGVIPKDQYGGGTVMLWDRGTWIEEGDAQKAYQKGNMTFELRGKKLKGLWKLVRIKKDEKNWLLIKIRDAYSNDSKDFDILQEVPNSVISKRDIEGIASHKHKTWQSKQSTKKKTSVKKNKFTTQEIHVSQLMHAKKMRQPKIVAPQLAVLAAQAPVGDDWIHEIKYDGYRFLCFIKNNQVKLMSRNQKDWGNRFVKLKDEIEGLNLKDAVLDGELVAINKYNQTDFQVLQNSISEETYNNLIYFVFDIIYYQGYDLKKTPLLQRKELLKNIFSKIPEDSMLRYSDHVRGDGELVFENACKLSLEGIISKNIFSGYHQRRTQDWLKIKCFKRQEFVIGGYTTPKGSRQYFGSLLLGFYDEKKRLNYCGHVGTGFTQKSLQELYRLMIKKKIDQCPFISVQKIKLSNAHWIKPELVAEIEYISRTKDNILRQPSFKGLRQDKKPQKIGLEFPKKTRSRYFKNKDNADLPILTNPQKILFPEIKLTKQDLWDYYDSVAEWILPYVINRPLTLFRCPEGYKKECFFQKHFDREFSPKKIFNIEIREKRKKGQYVYIKDIAGLFTLVQYAVLEIHCWGSQITHLEKPDIISFDLDPADDVDLKKLIKLTHFVGEQLELLGLESFVKTSGGKGFHILVPIKPQHSWEEVKDFSAAFANMLTQIRPQDFTDVMSKTKRTGKIFVDYLRNSRGATTIAPYSTRARANAPVSVPIAWSELSAKISPSHFTISNVVQRLKRLKRDPWESFYKIKQSISKYIPNK